MERKALIQMRCSFRVMRGLFYMGLFGEAVKQMEHGAGLKPLARV